MRWRPGFTSSMRNFVTVSSLTAVTGQGVRLVNDMHLACILMSSEDVAVGVDRCQTNRLAVSPRESIVFFTDALYAPTLSCSGKTFVPPYEDPQLKLGGLLALNLHEFSSDVEEIADQVCCPDLWLFLVRVLRYMYCQWMMQIMIGFMLMSPVFMTSICVPRMTGHKRGEDGSHFKAASGAMEQCRLGHGLLQGRRRSAIEDRRRRLRSSGGLYTLIERAPV